MFICVFINIHTFMLFFLIHLCVANMNYSEKLAEGPAATRKMAVKRRGKAHEADGWRWPDGT